jgi:hypothetical protein
MSVETASSAFKADVVVHDPALLGINRPISPDTSDFASQPLGEVIPLKREIDSLALTRESWMGLETREAQWGAVKSLMRRPEDPDSKTQLGMLWPEAEWMYEASIPETHVFSAMREMMEGIDDRHTRDIVRKYMEGANYEEVRLTLLAEGEREKTEARFLPRNELVGGYKISRMLREEIKGEIRDDEEKEEIARATAKSLIDEYRKRGFEPPEWAAQLLQASSEEVPPSWVIKRADSKLLEIVDQLDPAQVNKTTYYGSDLGQGI